MVYERERDGGRAELASSLSGREIRVFHTKKREVKKPYSTTLPACPLGLKQQSKVHIVTSYL